MTKKTNKGTKTSYKVMVPFYDKERDNKYMAVGQVYDAEGVSKSRLNMLTKTKYIKEV